MFSVSESWKGVVKMTTVFCENSGNAAIMGKAARVSGLQMHKQSKRVLSYLPGVHLHVMCVEEEDGGRNESDVKVADINLNLCCIHIYQPY
jgi:hypothetical protein